MSRFGYIILLLVVVGIAATSSWLLKRVDTEPFDILKPVAHNKDYFLTNFDATVMDKAGKPHYNLKGNYLEHFPDDDSIDIVKPKIKMFREKLAPWNVHSEKARVVDKGKLIHLNGKVSMYRLAGKDEPKINLDTSNLTINLNTDYAETKDIVIIQTEKHRLKAVGMRVYLAEGRLELLSKVTGVYDVTKK